MTVTYKLAREARAANAKGESYRSFAKHKDLEYKALLRVVSDLKWRERYARWVRRYRRERAGSSP